MKNLHLKIFSIFLVLLCSTSMVWAYQTVAFEFPSGENWRVVYHKKRTTETIVQYVPVYQSAENWNKTVVIHSYKAPRVDSASALLRGLTRKLVENNDYSKYVFVRSNADDAIATRCVNANHNMRAQCDIYRAMRSFEGFITFQYINKNSQDFKNTYLIWLEVVKGAKPYYSHYRTDRVLDKELNFEL